MADPLKQICDGLGVCREEALFYLEGFRWDLDAAMEACRTKTLPSLTVQSPQSPPGFEKSTSVTPHTHPLIPHSRPILNPSDEHKRIEMFCEFVGATSDDAKFYLSINNWDLNQAVDKFIGDPPSTVSERKPNSQPSLQSFPGTSDFMKDARRREHQIPVNLASTRISSYPSSTFMRETVNEAEASSSSMRSSQLPNSPEQLSQSEIESIKFFLEVAIGESPQTAKAYLDYCKWDVPNAIHHFFENVRRYGGDVEDDSRTVIFPGPFAKQDGTIVETQTAPDIVTITIVLADDGSGRSLVLPFRSNETVRDIRNAIDKETPENERDYYLQSTTGEEYKDLNITVYKISTCGSTTLLQIFSDP